jgi:ankyrin repeat protein
MIQKLLALIENLKIYSSDLNEDLFHELKSFMNDTNIELNDAQKNAINEADFNLNKFTQLLSYIDRLAKTYNKTDIDIEEKKETITTLKTLIITSYNQIKPKSIEQLKNEERISEIASRYNKLKHKIEIEYLILQNAGGKTFIHHLFENNADVKDIIFFINNINKLPERIIETYLAISYNKLSALDLLIEKSKTYENSWLRDITIGNKKISDMKSSVTTADAHTKSLEQSFVRISEEKYSTSLEFKSDTLTDEELKGNLLAVFYNKNYSLYQSLMLTTLYTYSDNIRVAKFANDLLNSIKPRILLEFNENNAVYSTLIKAFKCDNLKIVKYLLEAGANIEDKNRLSDSIHAAVAKSNIGLVKLLLHKGVDINVKDKDSRTSLLIAAHYGETEIARLLIEAGADVNARQSEVYSPLSMAADYGHAGVVRLLIEANADLEVRDYDGYTEIHRALNRDHIEIVELLISAGANLDTKDNFDVSLLSTAIKKGHLALVELIINSGANLDTYDLYGNNVLCLAIEHGQI